MGIADALFVERAAMPELVSCPICFDVLQEPKISVCHHVFCDQCWQRVVFSAGGAQLIPCPLCRRELRVASLESAELIGMYIGAQLAVCSDDAHYRCQWRGSCILHSSRYPSLRKRGSELGP